MCLCICLMILDINKNYNMAHSEPTSLNIDPVRVLQLFCSVIFQNLILLLFLESKSHKVFFTLIIQCKYCFNFHQAS